VLGPVARVDEAETALQFLARVDTGARTCSLHTSEKQVLNGAEFMEDNLGKTVRFRIENRQGESQWVERTIAEVREIRTSEGEEMRYLVPMALTVDGVEREVLVSLNDRSRMSYTMLLGRNFLDGEFLVDVSEPDVPRGGAKPRGDALARGDTVPSGDAVPEATGAAELLASGG
ncbi:MAG: ATP-dependent zinc protease family protein, partial [Bythopirellula sp.]